MKKKTKNEWKIIKIEDLPEGEPVIALQKFPTKSFAEFHLTTHVLYPLDGDWQFKNPATKKKLQKS